MFILGKVTCIQNLVWIYTLCRYEESKHGGVQGNIMSIEVVKYVKKTVYTSCIFNIVIVRDNAHGN